MSVITDFSDFHHQVSTIFKQPQSSEEWEQYRLTDEQVAHFHEFGYVSGIKLLEENQLNL
ncbi:MAG: hypothetical protein ACI9TK_001093 [Flavobacteriaceae bacterium]|jgi:hypothetical protein